MTQVVSGTNTFDYGNMYNFSGKVVSKSGLSVTVTPANLENILWPLYNTSGTMTSPFTRTTIATLNVTINLATNSVRTSASKAINLKNLLPVHLEYSETGEFLEFFETYLNEMYEEFIADRGKNEDFTVDENGTKSYYRTEVDSEGDTVYQSGGQYYTSAGYVDTNLVSVPSTFPVEKVPSISILEKIKRIADFHDPDLIDMEYIEQLSTLMGYDINIFRPDMDSITESPDNYDSEKYLRNVVTNLPHWYKIKATDNSIRILLYSFGIVAEVVKKWTSEQLSLTSAHPYVGGYGEDPDLWIDESASSTQGISGIPDDYFPTPHFRVKIDQDLAAPDWYYNLDKIFEAIESVRSINSVLDSVDTLFNQQITAYARVDHFGKTILNFGEVNTMSVLTVNEPQGNQTFTTATDDLDVKWAIGFHPTCGSPVEEVDISVSYDNKATWNTVSADAQNLILSGVGTNLFTDTSAMGIFNSGSWPAGAGDGTNTYIRIIEVFEGTTTGNDNMTAYSQRFSVI